MDSYCAKCFETFAEGSNVLPTPCGHIFHKTCLSKMLGTVHILRKHSNSTNFSQKLIFGVFFVKTTEFIFQHYLLTKFSWCSLKFLVDKVEINCSKNS